MLLGFLPAESGGEFLLEEGQLFGVDPCGVPQQEILNLVIDDLVDLVHFAGLLRCGFGCVASLEVLHYHFLDVFALDALLVLVFRAHQQRTPV